MPFVCPILIYNKGMAYHLQYTLFTALAALAAIACINIALYAWAHRAAAPREACALVRLALAIVGWLVCNTLELIAPTPESTLFWAKLTYLFAMFTPPLWLIFALAYTKKHSYFPWRYIEWTFLIPLITVALVWTNDVHQLIWRAYIFIPIDGLLAMQIITRGAWAWVFIMHSYGLTLLGTGLFLHQHVSRSKPRSAQYIWLVIGSLLPIAISLVYLLRIFPWLRKDYTPISFMLASGAFFISLYHYRLFAVKPLARELLLETMQAAIFVLDERHSLVDINRAARQLLDLAEPVALPLPVTVLLGPYPELLELLQTEASPFIETTRYHADTHTHYEWRSWPLRDNREQLKGWMLLGQDITTRKHTENTLRAREARLSALLASMQDYVFVIDREGRFSEYYQPTKAAELYMRPEHFLGRSYREVLPPAVSEQLEQAITALRKGRMTQVFTYPLAAGEAERWFMAQLNPLQNVTGVTYAYLGVVRDITNIKRTEQALRQSEARYQFVVQSQHEVICRYLPDTTLTFVNAAYCRMLGQQEADLLGQSFITFLLEAEQRLAQDVLAQLTPESPTFTHERPMLWPDGTQAWYEWYDQGFFDAAGHLQEVLSVGRDITERKQAREQILEHQRQLAALKERERLARDLHDGIGQVLGYLNVQSQAALDYLKDDPTIAAELLERLGQVTRDAHSDVRGYILGLKRGEEMALPFLSQLHETVKQFAEVYGFEVQLNLPAELPDILAEPEAEAQLLYIIREALNNARQHSGAISACVTLRLDAEAVTVIISDSGQGFNLTIEHLLERGPSQAHMGLQVMIERAEAVGGRFSVQTAFATGTTITVDMPRRHPLKALPQLRILLVDDHPLFLQGLRNLLSARGLEVVGMGRNGLEAHDLARNLRPDLVLMDLNMPECDGLEATLRIKRDLPDTKIVILTVSAEEKNIYQALKSGASGYLLKNLSADGLSQLIADIMRGEVVLSPGIAAQVLQDFAQELPIEPLPETTSREARDHTDLTPRQIEILELVAQGKTYKEIGTALFITERTVKYHMGEILERLQLENRRQAIAFARRAGIDA